MQRVDEEAFIRDIVYAEQITDTLHIADSTGEEMPVLRIGLPCICVIAQGLRPIMDRIESDGEQHQIFPEPLLKLFLNYAKIIRRADAIFGQGTASIDKVKGNYFARELTEVQ